MKKLSPGMILCLLGLGWVAFVLIMAHIALGNGASYNHIIARIIINIAKGLIVLTVIGLLAARARKRYRPQTPNSTGA